jgi:hypothetical protein
MQQARSQYIVERLQNFADLLAKAGDYRSRGVIGIADNFERRAWIEYGKALHPIMDSTSPVHNQEWRIRDRHVHGDYPESREDINTAPAYREETVKRMHDIPSFIIQR